MSELIRILIADDHPVVRQGLANFLIPRNGVEIVGEAENGREAVEKTGLLQPDVILMDIVMPEMNGAQATALIKENYPKARILILTSFGNEEILEQSIRAGAQGYLLKDSQPDDLLQAVRSVYQGQMTIPPHLALKMIDKTVEQANAEPPLTKREREVLAAVSEGLSNKEISGQLGISTNTVRSHVSNILRKLNLVNRTQLAIYGQEHAHD